MSSDPVVISAYARTPMGGFMGVLSSLSAPELGAAAVRAAIQRSSVPADKVDAVFMGCVLSAGLGQAPARQVVLSAGMPVSVPAVTVNKMCGSGMQAAIFGSDSLAAGSADVIIAGGMESMSNTPYLLSKHRRGTRIGHDTVTDSMYRDGLEDAYSPDKLMGAFADEIATIYQFSREAQDAYAIESLVRANAAIQGRKFASEIATVTVNNGKTTYDVSEDEQPGKARLEKIPHLKPVFAKGGTITAANSSSISDGAAALVMTRARVADRLGLPALARVVAHAVHADQPRLFATAPVPAIRKVIEKAGWNSNEVDLFEVNEAFAVVAMIAMRELNIPHEKLNVNGGACALGHPIGTSGARIMVTLIAALQARGVKRGVAAICIGGGEAAAVAVELI